jgi:DNA (cytosine-5)-methyltransferase 1
MGATAMARLKTTPERSSLMSRVRQSGNDDELFVRRLVRAYGFRCSANVKGLPGSPDIASKVDRFAIFVHGCFWHAHNGCSAATTPKRNRDFWQSKFKKNRERDRRKASDLRRRGFRVLTIWECEIRDRPRIGRKVLRFLERVRNERLGAQAASDTSARHYRQKFSYDAHSSAVVRRVMVGRKTLGTSAIAVRGDSRRYVDAYTSFDHARLRDDPQCIGRCRNDIVSVADLFCGCGGLSLGARDAAFALGFEFAVRFAIDSNVAAMDVYKRNFAPDLYDTSDIGSLVDGSIGSAPTATERTLLRRIGTVDILLAGPPCQGHSNLNNQTRRSDARNHLYERVARFAELARPKLILIENVPAVENAFDQTLFHTIDVLRRHAYHVSSGVVNLANLGVPQHRRRHVVIASAVRFVDIKGVENVHAVEKHRSLWWAAADLQDEVVNGVLSQPSSLSATNRRRVHWLHRTGNFDLPDRYRPACHRGNNHSYRSMYGRLRFDQPVQTITGGFSSPGQGRFVHPSRERTLTAHEAARVQFFPDSFDFSSVTGRTALAEIIGNAAPSRLSYVFVLDHLIALLGE